MKLLAIGRPRPGIDARETARHAKVELEHLWRKFVDGLVREMYSPGGPGRDLLGRRSRRGRAVRLVAAILLGLALARALGAFGLPADLRVVPGAALVACLLTLPSNLNWPVRRSTQAM